MASRYFAFGCSYVHHRWGTLADLIAANFDEYYNFGQAGSCNTFTLGSILQVDKFYNFNKDTDYITIGITGFGRYSILEQNGHSWLTAGDVLPYDPKITIDEWAPSHNEKVKLFFRNFESYTWAIFRSWVAVISLFNYLKSKNIKFTIYPSVDNSLFLEDFDVTPTMKQKVYDIIELCDIKESIDQFIMENSFVRGITYDDGSKDTHPTQIQYYQYLKKNFSMFDTELTKKRFDFLESIFTYKSMNQQTLDFVKKFVNVYRTNPNKLCLL